MRGEARARGVLRRALVGAAVALGVGCSSTPLLTYTESNLQHIRVGDSKERILAMFAMRMTSEEITHGMTIRAAAKDGSGNLIEVGEVLLVNEEDVFKLIPYWFLFENRRLQGWGRPEDWRAFSARYQIDFTPSAPVLLH